MPTLLRRATGEGPRWLTTPLVRVLVRVFARGLAPVLALLLALAAPALRAQDLLAVPALTARVIDQTGTLDAAALGALEAKLAAFEAQAGPQIVVLLVATTAPEDIASYVQRLGDAWKVGRREVGDGLLVVVAKNDRKVWIAPAKALEGAVPDLAARQIIQNQITPAFKRNDFAGGLDAGVDALMARIRGEALPAPTAPAARGGGKSSGLDWEALAMFFFVGVPVVGGLLTAVMGRKLGSAVTAAGTGTVAGWLGGSLLIGGIAGVVALVMVGLLGVGASGRRGGSSLGVPPVIFGGGGRGGWGGGGGGGGGFSSGGGGNFGGGGAGGSW
jgi:uncharacterized protein